MSLFARRRTRIVCTLGPASNSRTEIMRLARAGMDVARLNFSHGTPEDHGTVAERVRSVAASLGRSVALLQDLPGPKIRIGRVAEGGVRLRRGSLVRFVGEDVEGDGEVFSLPHPCVLAALRPGSEMWLADGLIHMRVVETGEGWVRAKVLSEGVLSSHKGVNLPDVDIAVPGALERDLELFRRGLEMGVDWVAVSFVGGPEDAEPFRQAAREAGREDVRLLAKVERRQALARISSIIAAFDGVLVARGDLGIETPIRDVPAVQKRLVHLCNEAGKPVVVATQMLMSMVASPRPTRAEATDVANAILDGADAVMLSEETAVGRYPARCVSTMASIASSAEGFCRRSHVREERSLSRPPVPTEVIAFGAARMAGHLGARAIITCTSTGASARAVSKHRPDVPILAAVTSERVAAQLCLSWGVRPYIVPPAGNTDEMIFNAVNSAMAAGMVKWGDPVVIVAGVPAGVPGNTCLVKYHRVGDTVWM